MTSHGVGRAPKLFDLDPRIQDLLSLESFKVFIFQNALAGTCMLAANMDNFVSRQGDASSTEFIEAISAGLIDQTKEYSGKGLRTTELP
jgi:hypothetical protein